MKDLIYISPFKHFNTSNVKVLLDALTYLKEKARMPDDMSTAFILYDKERYPLIPTDKNANCYAKRQNAPAALDYSKLGGI